MTQVGLDRNVLQVWLRTRGSDISSLDVRSLIPSIGSHIYLLLTSAFDKNWTRNVFRYGRVWYRAHWALYNCMLQSGFSPR